MPTTSNTPPAEAIAEINSGLTVVTRRAEIYLSDGSTPWTPSRGTVGTRLIGGTVNLDYGRSERRTLDMSLDNSDGLLSIATNEGFWYNKIIKVYRGVSYNIPPVAPHYKTTDSWECQIGEFMVDKIDSSTDDPFIQVVGRDYTKKCLQSKFEYSVIFDAGTYIYTIIKALAANAGVAKVNIPFNREQLTSDLSVERGTDRWSVMNDIANSFGYDIYFTNNGYLTMTKYPDPSTSPTLGRFKRGPGGNLVTAKKSTDDSRLYNHIIVTGEREAVEGGQILLPYFGEARNDNALSPTSIAQIGDRSYFYTSSFFTSNQQCINLAAAWLKIYSLQSYNMDWSSVVYPWFDVGKIVELEDPDNAGTYMRLLMDTLNIPLGLEAMSGTGKRVLAIG